MLSARAGHSSNIESFCHKVACLFIVASYPCQVFNCILFELLHLKVCPAQFSGPGVALETCWVCIGNCPRLIGVPVFVTALSVGWAFCVRDRSFFLWNNFYLVLPAQGVRHKAFGPPVLPCGEGTWPQYTSPVCTYGGVAPPRLCNTKAVCRVFLLFDQQGQ